MTGLQMVKFKFQSNAHKYLLHDTHYSNFMRSISFKMFCNRRYLFEKHSFKIKLFLNAGLNLTYTCQYKIGQISSRVNLHLCGHYSARLRLVIPCTRRFTDDWIRQREIRSRVMIYEHRITAFRQNF